MAQKPTAKKTVAEDPRYTQALQSYEAGLRAMQEHKFDKAKPHFQKVICGAHPGTGRPRQCPSEYLHPASGTLCGYPIQDARGAF